jgi:hypothetical protein
MPVKSSGNSAAGGAAAAVAAAAVSAASAYDRHYPPPDTAIARVFRAEDLSSFTEVPQQTLLCHLISSAMTCAVAGTGRYREDRWPL